MEALLRTAYTLFATLLIAALFAPRSASAANEVFDNGLLRFGNGSAQASVNDTGNLQGPMYHDNTLNGGGWFYLTISNNPLDLAFGAGGDGTSNWNVNGSISENQALTDQVIDASGYVRTGPTTGYGRIVSTGRILVGSNSFELRTTYTLGATDAFVKINTRVTNDGASPLTNLRVWVGTHDDWIGLSDSSQKQRGNLVNGVFTPLANAATRAEAIQISAGNSGVLFYTTSPRGYTSVNSCCSFNNVYNQDPATAAITVTNDGSYAMFVRMNDLAIGQSDEFDWYYAAGELANLSNIVASVGTASSSGPVTLTRNVLATPFTPVSVSGGTAPYSYSISPALPIGLTLNTTTGEVTGTPTVASATTTYTVTITDSAPATTSGTFNMTVKDTQSILFDMVPAQTYAASATFALAAAASSGLPVSLASQTSGVCSVTGTTATILSAGTCTIRAGQAGNASFIAAPDVDQNISIGQASQAINFPAVGQQIYLNAGTFGISATATSGLGVGFASLTASVCTVMGTTITMQSPGTCTIRASQSGNVNYASATPVDNNILIGKLDQTITFNAIASQTYAPSATFSVSATANSGLAVSFTADTPTACTISGSLVSILAAGTCTVRAAQAGNATYNAAVDALSSVDIAQSAQTITFAALVNQPLAGASLSLSASSSSGLAVTFNSQTPAICSVSGNRATMLALGTCTVRASQAGNTNYLAATQVDRSLTATQAVTQVSLTSNTSSIAYGMPITMTFTARGFHPTGRVDFMTSGANGFTSICTSVVLNNGMATCDVPGSFLRSNPVIIVASYSGDTNNQAGIANYQQLVSLGQASVSVTVNPQVPVAGRSATLSAMITQARLDSRLAFFENGVAVPGCAAVPVAAFGGSNDLGGAQCVISSITAGVHTYVVTYPNASGTGFDQVYVTFEAAATGPQDYTGMWWAGLAENGWGLSVDQHGGKQFVQLYVYDNSGNPVFYALPVGVWNSDMTAYTGNLYQPTGSSFAAYDASKFAANAPVGTATITYTSNATATLAYTINGISGTKQITRELFSDGVNINVSIGDMWWGGTGQNGWGMNISHQGSVLFPVWYTYDESGRNTWYTMPGGSWNGATYTGDLYRSTSSAWLGLPYNVGLFTPVKVGQISVTFIDENTASVTFNVNGVVRTETISRQPY